MLRKGALRTAYATEPLHIHEFNPPKRPHPSLAVEGDQVSDESLWTISIGCKGVEPLPVTGQRLHRWLVSVAALSAGDSRPAVAELTGVTPAAYATASRLPREEGPDMPC